MRFFQDISKIPQNHTYVVTVGNFDGLHLGHRTLLSTMKNEAKKCGWKTLLISFVFHTKEKNKVKLLYPREKKREIIANIGIDYQLMLDFEEIKMFSYIDFLKWINGHLNFGMFIASDKLKFGRGREGNLLRAKVAMEKINPQTKILSIKSKVMGNEVISSTLIRNLMDQGDVKKISQLLGSFYAIEGIATPGNQIGQKIGFPTLNIYPSEDRALPMLGVYFTRVTLNNDSFSALSFVGIPSLKKTGKKTNQLVIESHLLNFKKSSYNCDIIVEFIEFCRDNVEVDSLDELKILISKDKKKAESFFESCDYLV